ncbi:MAG: hypothetical protein JNM88_01600 [Chitinophagaceae bacterium]|nr:hypothetical protein [Chitinophagaceae bacterium]
MEEENIPQKHKGMQVFFAISETGNLIITVFAQQKKGYASSAATGFCHQSPRIHPWVDRNTHYTPKQSANPGNTTGSNDAISFSPLCLRGKHHLRSKKPFIQRKTNTQQKIPYSCSASTGIEL